MRSLHCNPAAKYLLYHNRTGGKLALWEGVAAYYRNGDGWRARFAASHRRRCGRSTLQGDYSHQRSARSKHGRCSCKFYDAKIVGDGGKMGTNFYTVVTVSATLLLAGCNAVTTAIEHRDLVAENKMTDTVFLDPVSQNKKTIYIQVRNTTDQQDFDISSDLKQAIQVQGYNIVADPTYAHYVLQVNVLQVGKMDKSTMNEFFASGFGAAHVIGATAYGAGIGALASGLAGAGYGALIAAPVALVADAIVKSNNYCAITDVQISERTTARVTDRMSQRLTQGRSGTRDVNSEQTTDQKVYQTRVMSSADQVNLDLADAIPVLKTGITRSIAGIF